MSGLPRNTRGRGSRPVPPRPEPEPIEVSPALAIPANWVAVPRISDELKALFELYEDEQKAADFYDMLKAAIEKA